MHFRFCWLWLNYHLIIYSSVVFFFSFLLCWLQCTLSTTMLKKGGTRVYTLFILLWLHRKKGVLKGVDVGILWSYVMVVTGVPGGKPLTLDRRPLPCHKRTSGIEPELQQWQARFSPPALSTPLKKGSHLIKILQAIVFIWLHTCLSFRTNQFTWGVFNNVSDGGSLDVMVPGFTHCKYVALSTTVHLVEHSLGL